MADDTHPGAHERRDHRSRRGRNHPQHGAAASVDARRAAREAAPGRREGDRLGVRDRLPAPRRGENRRAPQLPAVRALRGPHGLRRGGFERPGLLRGGREAAGRGSAAARARDPHDPHRTAAHRQPPVLAGHARAGYRRADAAVLLPARARRDPENFREVLRRAAHHARVPHRRPAVRGLRRVGKRRRALLQAVRQARGRVRSAAHREPHLGGAHQGHRHTERRGRHRHGRYRAGDSRAAA